jgi:hypothetical protein
MDRRTTPEGLTAFAFFKRDLPGCSQTDAHLGTGISYSTVHDLASGKAKHPRTETLEKLQTWSLGAGAPHGVYISAAKTLGVAEPDFAKTGT